MRALVNNKLVLIGSIALTILVPLQMIDGLIAERESFHRQAINEMAETSTGPQRLIGPVLLLPCEETYQTEHYDHEAKETRHKAATRDCTTYALPESLSVNGALTSDIRSRGIHEALFYTSDLAVKAHFVLPSKFGSGGADTSIKLGTASLNIGFADIERRTQCPRSSGQRGQNTFCPRARKLKC